MPSMSYEVEVEGEEEEEEEEMLLEIFVFLLQFGILCIFRRTLRGFPECIERGGEQDDQ